jgi:hypothetical protein
MRLLGTAEEAAEKGKKWDICDELNKGPGLKPADCIAPIRVAEAPRSLPKKQKTRVFPQPVKPRP